ncbi:MAG: hypothetical protein KKG09_10640 [Verrucomicrobia bacterium]|nr:hypothetical protein [Verrucomicrobiota bacterium]MCG2679983.1 hypothetical protein [Kiritimatiellia bacterium]MBU4247368.1 hypothetical protein [Verrucomicrobiota bacterium]MBU4290617.1 hypothetical protein [Verrucomicrobiota bacterium]MBU4429222.1 hypothetical protein [Verrucomicrobiota bacterium]
MTISAFSYKTDWARAQSRWDAFWALDAVDRPCMRVFAPRPDGKKITFSELRSLEDKWINPDYVLAGALHNLEGSYLGGETVPAASHFMAGTTTGCDGHLHFHEGGISIRPTMAAMDEPLNWYPGPQDPWRSKVDAICNRLLDEAPGRFIVSCPAQFDHVDLLNMLRGNEEMLLDLAINPDQCAARLHEMRGPSEENWNHFRQLLDSRQGDVGWVSWTGIWCRQLFRCAQADVAAVISPEMFERLVLPELDWQGERYERLHYHTCGYKQHLELCLSRPYIRVIQYSPNMKEPPNGPAHMEFYRRVQKAGRCLDIGIGADVAEFMIRHLRPEGLCLSIPVKTVAEADELLTHAVKWSGTHIHQAAF